MQNEEIEIQLWDYIDGTCNEQDHQRIASLIASDIEWQTLYHELQTLNNKLLLNTTFEKLPDGFANSVMTDIQFGVKKRRSAIWLDWGIRGVVAFFIISILSILTYTLAQTDLGLTDSKSPVFSFNKIQLPHFDANIQLSNGALYATSFMVLIIALILIDNFVHRNRLKTI